MPHTGRTAVIWYSLAVIIAFVCVGWAISRYYRPSTYIRQDAMATAVTSSVTIVSPIPVTHVPTPPSVRGIYMTSWVAGTKDRTGRYPWRERVDHLLSTTELNTLVIDIKDDSGRISFPVTDPLLQSYGAATRRIPDIDGYIKKLHEEGVYVIGRIAVFQDPFLAGTHPEMALKNASTSAVWKDKRGLSWLDPAELRVWEYVERIAKEAYAHGFDEVNFDYVRFPTDGNTGIISYPVYSSVHGTKQSVITNFFKHLDNTLTEHGIPHSVDIFGQTTTNTDDMGIGQHFEDVLPYFDAVCPMVYPSHYVKGFAGYANPNDNPHAIVLYALRSAANRATRASSTRAVIRPWLQDFNYGGIYTAEKVRAQKQAVYDAGLSSWLLWDPAVRYTENALDQ